MASPLIGFLACIHLEFLESGIFKYIIPCNSNYFRYIKDIQLIHPQEIDLIKISERLNKIKLTIKFTHEPETNNSLPI